MKFEKFLKQTGTHGQIYTRDNGDRWLICDGVRYESTSGNRKLAWCWRST